MRLCTFNISTSFKSLHLPLCQDIEHNSVPASALLALPAGLQCCPEHRHMNQEQNRYSHEHNTKIKPKQKDTERNNINLRRFVTTVCTVNDCKDNVLQNAIQD